MPLVSNVWLTPETEHLCFFCLRHTPSVQTICEDSHDRGGPWLPVFHPYRYALPELWSVGGNNAVKTWESLRGGQFYFFCWFSCELFYLYASNFLNFHNLPAGFLQVWPLGSLGFRRSPCSDPQASNETNFCSKRCSGEIFEDLRTGCVNNQWPRMPRYWGAETVKVCLHSLEILRAIFWRRGGWKRGSMRLAPPKTLKNRLCHRQKSGR